VSAGIDKMKMPRPHAVLTFQSSEPLTQDKVLGRTIAGDPSGIAELYERHAASLFRTAYRMLGSRADAEDVVHDLFVGLPEALRRYEDRGRLDQWLTRIIIRLSLMHLRNERRRRSTPLMDMPQLAGTERSDARLELTELEQAVMALPTGLRAVFVLRQVEGYSYEEIAALLDISVGASRVRLARAIERLRRTLL